MCVCVKLRTRERNGEREREQTERERGREKAKVQLSLIRLSPRREQLTELAREQRNKSLHLQLCACVREKERGRELAAVSG